MTSESVAVWMAAHEDDVELFTLVAWENKAFREGWFEKPNWQKRWNNCRSDSARAHVFAAAAYEARKGGIGYVYAELAIASVVDLWSSVTKKKEKEEDDSEEFLLRKVDPPLESDSLGSISSMSTRSSKTSNDEFVDPQPYLCYDRLSLRKRLGTSNTVIYRI